LLEARRSNSARSEPKLKMAARATTRPEKKEPVPVATPVPAPVVAKAPQVNEAQEREQKLSGILSRMQDLLAPAGLTATKAGLAGELYAEAAKLAPSDARVRNAPNQIADAYLKLATTRADAKEYAEADSLIRKGLELSPNNRLLASLQKDIAERQKPKRQTFGGF
jgi:tetratricopeptide (TPR) repeat protein